MLSSLIAAALAASCGDGASSPEPALPGSGAPSAAESASEAEASHRFNVTSGSALALSSDGSTLFVADEDHLAVVVVPSTLHERALHRSAVAQIVNLPGPPAQIVASDGLVLVTVRSLPSDDARAAYQAIRGKEPQAEAVTRLPAAKLMNVTNGWWGNRFWVEKEYRPLLDPTIEMLPAHGAFAHGLPAEKPVSKDAAGAMPGGAASAMPRGPASARPGSARPAVKGKAPPRRNTPAVPLDANVLRRSQGGLLLAFRPDPEAGLVEIGRTIVAPDAWGVGVTRDGTRAVVTSAWSARVAVVDIESSKVVFSAEVAREPRGVAVSSDGKSAWISHLVGTDLTKIEDLDGSPRVSVQALAAAPARTPVGATLSASLGYAPVLSPDGHSLYLPRHAIGAEGVGSWWGAPVVDVLDLRSGKSPTPLHESGSPSSNVPLDQVMPPADWMVHAGQAPSPAVALTQPRAAVYRRKTDTLLIAGEGWDALAEVDALAAEPSMAVLKTFDLADVYDAFGHFPVRGGAPSAVALSADEDTAYVYCRTTFDIVKIDLTSRRSEWLRIAEDALPGDAALGRRLFTNARSNALSGGIGCAGCHPDGRDDGYVWREGELRTWGGSGRRFLALRANAKPNGPAFPGVKEESFPPDRLFPRQTPMLAGHVRASGPYGWHAEAPDLARRIADGIVLHRGSWDSDPTSSDDGTRLARLDYLMDYLRSGLLPPPTLSRALSEVEARGKTVFESDATKCATCHKPDTEHTDRTAYPLPKLPLRFGFDDEENAAFKTPSLRFVAGTAPYFHDGSAATLDELIARNGNRMGATLALSEADRAALVAYLKTL